MLDNFPDSARAWVFLAAEPISSAHAQSLTADLNNFLAEWHAHGKPVKGGFELLYGRFIVVAADSSFNQVSGCSIDSVFQAVQSAAQKAGIKLCDQSTIFYRKDGKVTSIERGAFEREVSQGNIGADTVVFNNAVSSLAEIRGGQWELAFKDSWHASRFPLAEAANS